MVPETKTKADYQNIMATPELKAELLDASKRAADEILRGGIKGEGEEVRVRLRVWLGLMF